MTAHLQPIRPRPCGNAVRMHMPTLHTLMLEAVKSMRLLSVQQHRLRMPRSNLEAARPRCLSMPVSVRPSPQPCVPVVSMHTRTHHAQPHDFVKGHE